VEAGQSSESEKRESIELGFEPESKPVLLLVDIAFFITAIKACYDAADARGKKEQIKKLLSSAEWFVHYCDKHTGRSVLSESSKIEYAHEKNTAIRLAQMNYDVVFAPAGMFKRNDKRFDVYLLRDTIILEADLKCISTTLPDTIAKRIISGSEQAARIVLDVKSAISPEALIDGLRSGTGRNDRIKEVLLFYKNKFYRLPKKLIWSKRIYEILKSEKGYT
jgi:hypothetical protein